MLGPARPRAQTQMVTREGGGTDERLAQNLVEIGFKVGMV
jgi:hypothetical protein